MKNALALGLLVIGAILLVLAALFLHQRPQTAPPRPSDAATSNSGSSSDLPAKPELSEIARKRAGLLGPFPIGEEVPESERQLGRVLNAWREAVVIKNINDIERLSREVDKSGESAIPFLRKLGQEDPNERVRAFAVRILGRMRRTDLTDFFMDRLKNDASPFVRENAAWALGEIGAADAVPLLQTVAATDASTTVRQSAQKALAAIKPGNK